MKRIFSFIRTVEIDRLLLPLLFCGAWFKGLYLQCYFEGANFYVPSLFEDPGRFFSGLFFSF